MAKIISVDGIENISDFKDLLKHSERVASKLWENKEDEIWGSV